MNSTTTLLIFSLLFVSLRISAKDVNIQFYSESLSVSYSPTILSEFYVANDELSIINYYHHLETLDFQTLLDDLDQLKERLKLNDWLYFELLQHAVNTIYKKESSFKQALVTWFLLSKEGFDSRVAYQKEHAYVYVYTTDDLYEVPMIRAADRTFVNLTAIYNQKRFRQALQLVGFPKKINNKSFSFSLDQFPQLKPHKKNKQIKFYHDKTTYSMKVKIDQTVIAFMQRYPVFNEKKYMDIPLSSTLASSLLPKLNHMLKGKNTKEALQLLVAFTRSSFQYKEDESQFGIAKPMIAEEVFYYPYSDCEDRSALFYVLVKELLDLPMVIIAFEDHLTIGVAIPQFQGDSIRFNGNDYYICDPTGPINNAIVGVFPQEYIDKPFEIIGFYQ